MILKPSLSHHLEMDAYFDSDFMGLFNKEDPTDPVSSKSETGYVISINGCPIIWSSKLQDGVALSTMMAEYYVLPIAMRDAILLRVSLKAWAPCKIV